MEFSSPTGVVHAWLTAVNQQDRGQLLALSDADITLAGPRGISRGHQVLEVWLDQARACLETYRLFARGDAVVAAHHARWHSPTTGELTGAQEIATSFRVAGQRVAHFARYDDLDSALAATGLGYADECALPQQ